MCEVWYKGWCVKSDGVSGDVSGVRFDGISLLGWCVRSDGVRGGM